MTDCPETINSPCAISTECAVSAASSSFGKPICFHEGLDLKYSINKGHIVAMFRQPEQRIISGFFDGAHSYVKGAEPTMLEYAQYIQGCQTKMLSRHMECESAPVCSDGIPPRQKETALALTRLHQGIAFVGITDSWDLSMCLFHAKFGGSCKAEDFTNVHPGTNSTARSAYDTSDLHGFVDEADNLIFAAAERLFREDLERFGVTDERCEATCWPKTGSAA